MSKSDKKFVIHHFVKNHICKLLLLMKKWTFLCFQNTFHTVKWIHLAKESLPLLQKCSQTQKNPSERCHYLALQKNNFHSCLAHCTQNILSPWNSAWKFSGMTRHRIWRLTCKPQMKCGGSKDIVLDRFSGSTAPPKCLKHWRGCLKSCGWNRTFDKIGLDDQF